jgi:hypothetical protein
VGIRFSATQFSAGLSFADTFTVAKRKADSAGTVNDEDTCEVRELIGSAAYRFAERIWIVLGVESTPPHGRSPRSEEISRLTLDT